MRFGLLLSAWRNPQQPYSAQVTALMTRAQHAADAGFSSVWANQRILADPWPALDTTALISRAAATVGDLDFGAVYLFPLHNPVRLAETVISLSSITNNRFTVAGTLGWRKAEFELLGVPLRERVPRFVETMHVLRAMTGRRDDATDLLERWPELATWVETPSAQDPVPVWVGAGADPGVRRAVSLGDAWLASSHTPRVVLERLCETYDDAVAGHESATRSRPVFRHCMIASTPRDAEQQFGPALRAYYERLAAMGLFTEVVDGSSVATGEALVQQLAVAGGVEECISQFTEYRALGFDDFILQVGLPGVPESAVLHAIDLLGSQVLPALC